MNATSPSRRKDPTVSEAHLAAAIRTAASMDIAQKERVCDRVYTEQPNLLGSVLVLKSLGVPMTTVDVVLNILIVLTLAVDQSGQRLMKVTEADQERELQRLVAMMRFTEGMDAPTMTQSIEQTTAYRREKFLLAYVIDTLQRAGLAAVRDDASQYSFLAAINLVNCIATADRRRLRN
jgi:hypothetical protein